MDDVRGLKHNLDYKEVNSFMKNYGWKEDQLLIAKKSWSGSQTWDNHVVEIYDLYTKGENISEIGYAILIDGEVKYLIGIYEPHGANLNSKRGCITAHGHEEIQLWLDDGEFDRKYTR